MRLPLSCFFLLILGTSTAQAGTASLLTLLQFCSESPSLNGLPCTQSSQDSASGTAQVTGSKTFNANGGFEGSASATSTGYVLFSGSSSLTLSSYQANLFWDPNFLPFTAGAFSYALDYLTVTGGSGAGVLRFYYDTESSQDNGGSSLTGGIYNVMAIQGAGQRLQVGQGTLQIDVPFDFGTELEVNFALYNAFSFYDNEPEFQPTYSYSGSMSSSVRLRGASVLDGDGNPVSGTTISAASGTDYATGSSVTTATPEPGTWWMMAVACAFLALQAGKRTLPSSN